MELYVSLADTNASKFVIFSFDSSESELYSSSISSIVSLSSKVTEPIELILFSIANTILSWFVFILFNNKL